MGYLLPHCPRMTCAAARKREYGTVCIALEGGWDEKKEGKPCPFYKRRAREVEHETGKPAV